MSNNIPGISRRIQPSVVFRSRTLGRSAVAAGGDRILCVIGEGETEEILVAAARGGGLDGVNSDYSGSNSPTGRHFVTSEIDLVVNRTSILKNGTALVVLESTIDSDPFDSRYEARIDPVTGRIELQRSYLVAVGGTSAATAEYSYAGATNFGNGNPVVTTASLVDTSAPAEVWTARCTSVVRDGYGDTISGQATFSVTGSVSGAVKDANGNPVRWRSDGVFVSNDVLNIAFSEGSVPYAVGDRFTITVASGVLAKNDELSVKYIVTANLNSPELLATPSDIFAKYGNPSTTNTLSLGVQMAFENGAPQVLCLQAKPSVPRRISATLLVADDPLSAVSEGATGTALVTDTVFPFPLGAQPDANTEVFIFAVSPDGTEEQLGLSKQSFYNATWNSTTDVFSGFVTGPYSQAYTVVETPQVEDSGVDGYITTLTSTTVEFYAPTAAFTVDHVTTGEDDTVKKLRILAPADVAAVYTITSIGDGYGDTTLCFATRDTGTHGLDIGYADVSWQLVDLADVSYQLAVTDDVAINNLTVGMGIRVSYVDVNDADFFDTNWAAALESLETANCQIVVPLPTQTISNIVQATRTHVETMSNIENGNERIMITGAIRGLGPDELVGRDLAAVEDIGLLEGIQGDDAEEVLGGNIEDLADYSVTAAFGTSYRVVYMAPDEIIRNISGTATALSGLYLAVALGGLLAGQSNVAEPATFKILNGFNILRSRVYRKLQLDELADAGVTVVQPVAGGGRILHGLTTTQSNAPEEEEISIVAIRDYVGRGLREVMRPFIGIVESPNLIASMTATISDSLSAYVSQGLLSTFGQVSVSRDPSEARQYNVVCQISPVGPVNWIYIEATVSL